MAYQNREACYVCERLFRPTQLSRMDGEENVNKREIAVIRRNAENKLPLHVDNRRLCINCSRSINQELIDVENNPFCLRLNVLSQTNNSTCFVCDEVNDIHRLSVECRIDAFIRTNIYISEDVKSCQAHLDDKSCILKILLPGLRYVNRPCVLKEKESFLEENNIEKMEETDENYVSEEAEEAAKQIFPESPEMLTTSSSKCLSLG
ncbi:unnamed protein product [Psylliodes chrysocephalus]|uniref:Uncharacterized protein n=1 Tax=Psylliodes chrysocephalus TaxID=3402493 RepID=A0A9P0G6I7_9CUCU|nr:unnamed protein product [Psylliodes chrysocephala]